MFLDVFGKEFREEICLEKCSKMPNFSSFFDLRGSGGIYNDFVTLGH